MKTKRLWAYVLKNINNTFVMFVFLGLSVAMPADARTQLPSSEEPSQGTWDYMTPSSFKGTVSDLLRQCRAQVSISQTDSMTPQKCELLEEQINIDMCVVVYIPDGISFTYLQGRRAGKSETLMERSKNLGREDRALWCDLGDGVHAYWFTGDRGKSCNNLAVVLLPEQVVKSKSVNLVCTKVPIGSVIDDSSYHYHDDVLVRNCGQVHSVSSHSFFMEGTLQSNGYTEHCVPAISQ